MYSVSEWLHVALGGCHDSIFGLVVLYGTYSFTVPEKFSVWSWWNFFASSGLETGVSSHMWWSQWCLISGRGKGWSTCHGWNIKKSTLNDIIILWRCWHDTPVVCQSVHCAALVRLHAHSLNTWTWVWPTKEEHIMGKRGDVIFAVPSSVKSQIHMFSKRTNSKLPCYVMCHTFRFTIDDISKISVLWIGSLTTSSTWHMI